MAAKKQVPEDGADAARRRDRTVGLVVVTIAFIVSLGISWWAKIQSRPETAEPPGRPTQVGVQGYPSAVDPLQALGVARSLTKRTGLRGIVAEGVRSDGTVDVSEGPGRVGYFFQSPPGHGPQPPRERAERSRQLYCGKQTVQLRREGMVVDPDLPEVSCDRAAVEPLPDPRCGAQELWRYALGKQATVRGLARIEYYRAEAGPAWRFTLPGTPLAFSLYGDCGRELDSTQAKEIAP